MRCDEYKKLIYLFSELDSKEKTRLQSHIQSCSACQLLFDEVQREGELLKKVYKVTSPAAIDLTEKIMRAIPERPARRRQVVDDVFNFIAGAKVRYAMAAASVVLVVSFISEINVVPAASANLLNQQPELPGDVRLDSDVFYEPMRQALTFSRQENLSSRLSLYECLRQCEENTNEACIDCKKKYLKNKI
jgi:hypothetical protein